MLHPIINTAVKAARQAGEMIIRARDKLDPNKIETKAHNDWVTNVDQAAENIIIDVLHEAYPKHNFLCEERGSLEFGDPDNVWIIDPLDGTTNYIKGLPHYVVSIALQTKGRLEHAVLYDPNLQEIFTASRGQGAQLNDKRIRVSSQYKFDGSILSFAVPRLKEYLPQCHHAVDVLYNQMAGLRRTGATALDLAYVAAGRLDAFWNINMQPWDLAAGVLLVREAGGMVTDLDGGDDFFEKQHCIAANPKMLKQVLQLLKSTP